MKLIFTLLFLVLPQIALAGGNVSVNGGGDRPSPSAITESFNSEKETLIVLPKNEIRWNDFKDNTISKPLPFDKMDRDLESNSNLF